MEFEAWLEQQGCTVEVTQPDDSSGYVCLEVWTPEMRPADGTAALGPGYDITVTA